MNFKPVHFDPGAFDADGTVMWQTPKGHPGPPSLYVYDRDLVLALNVALATKRPLLLAGEPGSGKSTLARNVAQCLGWTHYETTIGSRTQSSDLLWEYDALARLNDANTRESRDLKPDGFYVRPGALWWALDPDSAARRGMPPGTPGLDDEKLLADPGENPGQDGAVLLIDELDKAEPELPNDLLEVIDVGRFPLRDGAVTRRRPKVLLMFSTNGERDFPGAFLRRCVVYRFPIDRGADWFVGIAQRWEPTVPRAVAQAVAARLVEARREAATDGRRPPGTAEYLDALRAMTPLALPYDPGKPLAEQDAGWRLLEQLVFRKSH